MHRRFAPWRVRQYEGEYASSDTRASHRNLYDLNEPRNNFNVTAPEYSLRLCPAADKTYQPENQRNRHSIAAHREDCLGEEEYANIESQAAPTDSQATERSGRVRCTFSIQLLTC